MPVWLPRAPVVIVTHSRGIIRFVPRANSDHQTEAAARIMPQRGNTGQMQDLSAERDAETLQSHARRRTFESDMRNDTVA